MNYKLLALPALLLSLAACGPQGPSGGAATSAERVSVPALPVIQEAVRALYPTFNGKRIPVLVNHLCLLAQGQMTPQQSAAQLAQYGIDAARLPLKSADATALLVNGDRAAQAEACAAAQASAALTPLNPDDVMRSQPPGNASGDKKAGGEPARVIDQAVLGRLLSLKLGQARADADTFAIIATRLSATPGLTEPEYRQQAQAIFRELAPGYLARLKQQMQAQDTQYRLERLEHNRLTFTTNSGTRYDASTSDGLTLLHYGQPWYGRGMLLGMDYRLQVANLVQVGKPAAAQ
ncbi:hypothetical protein [Pseudomonas sp. SCB32]|uniref:hypothetical protein n=1 Tax=Pseudomonas sp. SCB32 TaxID=2653853 RepID=UPI0012656575|nr:hypothetical protein [Pseudomonas sp. SCB32]